MHGLAFVFFALFALVLVGMYLAIRRELAGPGLVAGIGVVLSIVMMVLMSLAQENSLLQAIVVGIVVGGLFSGITLAAAWYFHTNEMHARYAGDMEVYPQPDEEVAEESY